jgi:hypothetical protein
MVAVCMNFDWWHQDLLGDKSSYKLEVILGYQKTLDLRGGGGLQFLMGFGYQTTAHNWALTFFLKLSTAS